MRFRLRGVVGVILILFNAAWMGDARAKAPTTLAGLVTYTGAYREQILFAGAKAEGRVVWYTSLAGSSYRKLAQGFEKKYPGVKVDVYRREQ